MSWHILFLTLAHRCEHGHWPEWILLVWRYECRRCLLGRAH